MPSLIPIAALTRVVSAVFFVSLQTGILFQLISTGCALNLSPTEIAAQSLSLTHAMPLIVTREVCAWAPGPREGSGPETKWDGKRISGNSIS